MGEITINITKIDGTSYCIDSEDADRLYEYIKKSLAEGKKVNLDFQNVNCLPAAFLNIAIGPLY